MNTPEENPDDLFGKRLRERFDGFTPEVDESVRRNIFGGAAGVNKYYYLGMVFIVVLLGFLYVSENVKWGGGLEKVHSLSGQKESVLPELQDALVSKNISTKKETKPSESAHLKSVFSESNTAESSQKSLPKKHTNWNSDFQIPAPISIVRATGQPGTPETDDQSAVKNEILKFESKQEDLPKQPDLHLLEGKDAFFEKMDFASLITVPAVDSMIPLIKDRPASPAEWIFSMAALPAFQIVHLNSLPELSYQNVKFAPILSARSMSYKVSAGIEKRKFQLLLSYGYLRNWNTYEIGSSRVRVDRQDDQDYTAMPIGELHEIDEQLHLLGLSVRRTLMLPENFAKLNRATIGAEYTRVWPTGQNMYWGNMGIARRIVNTRHSSVQIGPYAQYSFSKRSVGTPTWKSQPYQIGLSAEVKFK